MREQLKNLGDQKCMLLFQSKARLIVTALWNPGRVGEDILTA